MFLLSSTTVKIAYLLILLSHLHPLFGYGQGLLSELDSELAFHQVDRFIGRHIYLVEQAPEPPADTLPAHPESGLDFISVVLF